MSAKIPIENIQFEPSSLIDECGRVFHWENNIFRAIKVEYADFHRKLFWEKNISALFEDGLIPTEITDYSLEGYDLILKHQRIAFTSYCYEWSPQMIKDAALLVCDLSIHLHKKGLAFKDAHPWNILFDWGKPVFVDWGSIVPLESRLLWPYSEFRDRFIFPLLLMSAGRSWLARRFMLDVAGHPSRGDIFRLLLRRISPTRFLRYLLADGKLIKTSRKINRDFLQNLRQMVESIPVTTQQTEWTEYEGPGNKFSHKPSEDWSPKIRNVYNSLKTCNPQTLLDIGCNKGWFSELAARQGIQVVATDLDELSVTSLYDRVRKNELNILPLVMDICAPTPPHGLAMVYPGADKRFQVEMVMALALTHHLVFKRNLSFDVIAAQLATYSKRWLLVEFVPPDDQHVAKWMNERFTWYNLDAFVKALKAYFKRIEILDSSPSPRLLVLCER